MYSKAAMYDGCMFKCMKMCILSTENTCCVMECATVKIVEMIWVPAICLKHIDMF